MSFANHDGWNDEIETIEINVAQHEGKCNNINCCVAFVKCTSTVVALKAVPPLLTAAAAFLNCTLYNTNQPEVHNNWHFLQDPTTILSPWWISIPERRWSEYYWVHTSSQESLLSFVWEETPVVELKANDNLYH